MRKLSVSTFEARAETVPAPYTHLEQPCKLYPFMDKVVARLVYQRRHGSIGDSRVLVCHKCDRGNCIEDTHHFLGSQKDNMKDAAVKGRIVHSEVLLAKLIARNKAGKESTRT